MCVTMTLRRQDCWTKQKIEIYYVLVTAIISRMALNPNSMKMVLKQPPTATIFWSVLSMSAVGIHSIDVVTFVNEPWLLSPFMFLQPPPTNNSTPTHPPFHKVPPHQTQPAPHNAHVQGCSANPSYRKDLTPESEHLRRSVLKAKVCAPPCGDMVYCPLWT